MIGSLLHGHYDEIDLQFDWYSGNCAFEAPGVSKITDLDWVSPKIYGDDDTGDAIVEAEIATSLGPIFKRLRFSAHTARVEYEIGFAWREWGRGSLRFGNFLLNPKAFDPDRLSYTTHNGGHRAEVFPLGAETVDHGQPVSFLVSASNGVGMTEGWLAIGDDTRSIRIDVDRTVAQLVGMVHHERTRGGFFARVALSALELDETRKPDATPLPRCFRFALTLGQ